MAGNVWEWCSSLHKPYPYIYNDGREDSKSTESRSLRGGSWDDYPIVARAAYRDRDVPGIVDDNVGFRLVRSAPGS